MTPSTMRAVRFHEFGPPQVMVVEEIPRPSSPGPGQVLVKVRSSGVNHIDVALRSGQIQARLPIELPAIPGVELSGIVEAVGADVTHVLPGQAVYSNAIGNIGNGSSAEYILMPATTVWPMPGNLTFDEAASVPHGARTAWSGLFTNGDLQPGQRVLVQGGAGGVGMYAVQLAHLTGAYVIATTSTSNVDFVRDLGADEVIDYTQTAAEDLVDGVDLVFDCVGGPVMDRSWQTLRPGGMLCTAIGFPTEEEATIRGVRASRAGLVPDLLLILERITQMIEAGELRIHVREIFPMEEIAAAHAMCASWHGRGRIVLHIAD